MREFTKIPNQYPLNLRSYRQLANESRKVHIPVVIALAIWSSPDKRLTLAQIRAAVAQYFPEVKVRILPSVSSGSVLTCVALKEITGTLYYKDMFVRLHRGIEHGGRGSFWGVDPSQQGSRKSGQLSNTPGSSPLDENLYAWALSAGVTPSMLHESLPSLGGEPHLQRPGGHLRRTPHGPY